MKLNKDILSAVQLLLDNRGGLTLNHFSKTVKVSRQQLKAIMEDTIYWIKSSSMQIKEEENGRIISMESEDLIKLRERLNNISVDQYCYSIFERRKFIIFQLIWNKSITNFHICEQFQISKNTCIADISAISKLLKDSQFDIKVIADRRGYHLDGKESEIRRLIPYTISLVPFFSMEQEYIVHHINESVLFLLYGFDYSRMTERVNKFISAAKAQGQEVSLQSAVYISATVELILARIKEGHVLYEADGNDEGRGCYSKHCIERIILKSGIWQELRIELDTLDKDVPAFCSGIKSCMREEKEMLQQTILCTASLWEDYFEEFIGKEYSLKLYAENILEEFENRTGLDFKSRTDTTETMVSSLSGILIRQSCGFKGHNPRILSIKKDYRYIYDITKKLLDIFEGVKMPDMEVCYFTSQMIGWMIQGDERKGDRSVPLVGVVCANNIGVGTLIEKQIQSTFPDIKTILLPSYEIDYWTFINKLDLVVSPMLLKIDEKVPYVRVNPILTEQDKGNIYRQLSFGEMKNKDPAKILLKDSMGILRDFVPPEFCEQIGICLEQLYCSGQYEIIYKGVKSYMLKDLLTIERIQITQEKLDWREAIRIASSPLIEDGSITQNYVRAMIDSIETTGPYIILTPGVALPHARTTEGSIKLAMSMLCSKNRIYFSEEKYANLLIVLSSVDGHSHINALVHLSNMFGDEDILSKFLNAGSAKEIVGLIDKYEED